MSRASPGQRIAEVVEATSTSLRAQCYRLYGAPPLGSLVRAGDLPVYAVVHNISTSALDPGRTVTARGETAESEDDVYRANPQIPHLLATYLDATVVGHATTAGARPGLPPAPPRIHGFVHACDRGEVAEFTRQPGFLRLLAAAATPAADEVMASCLRLAAPCHPDPEAFLLAAGKTLAAEMASDVRRLSAILRSALA